MAVYHARCVACGAEFTATRAATQPPPQYCSRSCYLTHSSKHAKVARTCEHCGAEFVRKARRQHPRYCSLECYWASGGPAQNSPFKAQPASRTRRRKYIGTVDGKPKYIPMSHWVWNQAHPDDPVQPGEHLHHIDGDRTNDDPSNLAKMTPAEHAELHASDGSLAGPSEVLSARMKAYHQANPGKQRKGKPKVCPVCGDEFYRPPSAKARTCSYQCAAAYRKAHKT